MSSGEGGSWTIIITDPAGIACMVAAGTGWESVPSIIRFTIAKTQ